MGVLVHEHVARKCCAPMALPHVPHSHMSPQRRVARTCSTTVDSPTYNDTNTYVHPQAQEHPPPLHHPHAVLVGQVLKCMLLAAIQPCLTCCCRRFGTMLESSQDSHFPVDAVVTMWSECSVGEAPECSGAHAGCAAASTRTG
jgi:hypothetical protein